MAKKTDEQFLENLKDRHWRLNNLYYIKDVNGKKVLFKPNWAQKEVIDNLWFFSIVLKARQLGVTTLFCILFLDQILFSENKTAAIVAHRREDAKKFFRDKIKFAWDNLPESLKSVLGPPETETVHELTFNNGSKIYVDTMTRGSTLNFLHLSEFGKICATHPAKAEEIVTGSINSVHQGNFVTIESTAEGREGYFYDFCKEAKNAQDSGRELTPFDFRYFFFPWWREPSYCLKGDIHIPKEFDNYFRDLEGKEGVMLDKEQKNWYYKKFQRNQDKTFREFPSNFEEAFSASISGAYYKKQMAQVYEEKRIMPIAHDSRLPVDTWWDLGMNDLNVILFTQSYSNEIRFIDMYYNRGEGLEHYVNVINNKPYTYGHHHLPHDVAVRNLGAQADSRYKILSDLGLINMKKIERSKNILKDIEEVRSIFSRFYFDEKNCQPLINALESYRKEWDDKMGEYKSYPRHDRNSHLVDPLRLLVKVVKKNLISMDDNRKEPQYADFF